MAAGLEVGTQSDTIEVTPTMDTSAYATGDRAGTIMTLSNAVREVGESATLQDMVILDKATQSAAMDIFFFNASPTVASADNAAIDITDAEMAKCVGTVTVAATDYKATASNSVATLRNLGLNMKPAAGSKDLFALIVSRGSPTYAAASLVFKFKFLQD